MISEWAKMIYRYMLIPDADVLTLLRMIDFCKTDFGMMFLRKYTRGKIRRIYDTIAQEMAEKNKNPGSAVYGALFRKYRR
jgi:hypothetical protein